MRDEAIQAGIARCRRLRSFKNAGLGTVDMLNDTMLSEELFHTPSGGFARLGLHPVWMTPA